MKAMILAAGRGSRLKPLTDTLPKPLLSIGSENLVEHNVKVLKQAGIDEVIINISHHAEQIVGHLGDGKRYGVTIHYSYERDRLLGTGGGIFQALPLLGNEPFIVMSADIWSDFPFDRSFIEANNEAHLIFVENPNYHPIGDYALSDEGKVIFEGPKFTYGNIAKLHPKLFANCQPGTFPLSQLFNEAISRGTVSGELYRGKWFNVGTIEELERLRKAIG